MTDYLNQLFDSFKTEKRELFFIANREERDNGYLYSFILIKDKDGFATIVAWEAKDSAEKVLEESDLDKSLYQVHSVSGKDFDNFMQRLSPERRQSIRIKVAK